MRARISSKTARLSTILLLTGGTLLASTAPAFATPSSFTPGDLVIYETQGTSSAAQAVDLVDYGTNGVPSGYSVALPTTNSGSQHTLTDTGSGINDGELTLSADGLNLLATGYNVPVGTAKVTSTGSSLQPRTVDIVNASGSVDSSTSLSDSQTEGTSASPNNFRSATEATANGTIYTGGDGGLGLTTDGGTSDTYLNTTDSVHDVQVLNGNLYDSTTSGINEIGSAGLPTGGAPADVPLITGANIPAGTFDPDQFAFVNLGTGYGPDTLYVADGDKNNAIEKFSLESGVWTLTGSVTVPGGVGLAADVTTNPTTGLKQANIYVTGEATSGASNNTELYGITDTSGYEGTLSATPVELATAPTGTDFHGLAFAPDTTLPNNGDTPEVPYAVVLPILAALLFGGGFLAYRRRTRIA